MTSPSEPMRPGTEAGRRLVGSILMALQQEGADVADLSWVDQVADVEREVARSLDVERLIWRLIESYGGGIEIDNVQRFREHILARLAPARNDAGEPG